MGTVLMGMGSPRTAVVSVAGGPSRGGGQWCGGARRVGWAVRAMGGV